MKRGVVACLALGLVALADAPLQAQPGGRGNMQAAQFGWLSSLAAGKSEARRTGKPLMVVLRCIP